MASSRFHVGNVSYEEHLRRSVEANFRAAARAAAQQKPPRDLGELLRLDRDEIIYLPGPKAKTNAIGIPLIRAALGEKE